MKRIFIISILFITFLFPIRSFGRVLSDFGRTLIAVGRIEEILDDLNPQQREAVTYRGKYLLVSAGAGSGKTRLLTSQLTQQATLHLFQERVTKNSCSDSQTE